MKRLYRSRKERMIAGVCMGVAEYFQVDVVIVRLAWVLLALAGGGTGIIAYIIAWIIVPEEPLAPQGETTGSSEPPEPEEPAQADARTQKALGYIIVAVGLFFLLRTTVPAFRWHYLWGYTIGRWWPLLLVGLGLAMVLGVFDRRRSG